jgi:hypothetical protein
VRTGQRPSSADLRSPLRSSERARTCVVCEARLSSYNPEPTCFTHTVALPWRGPTQRYR